MTSASARGMLVCPQPPAAEAALAVLRDGGNAVDAAVATALDTDSARSRSKESTVFTTSACFCDASAPCQSMTPQPPSPHTMGSILKPAAKPEPAGQVEGPRVASAQSRSESGWTAHEVLPHITAVTGFWSEVAYQVARGEATDVDLLRSLRIRDVVGARLARRDPGWLVEQGRAQLGRLIEFLQTASPEDMLRAYQPDDTVRLTAEDVVRLAVINHVELHLDQLQDAMR